MEDIVRRRKEKEKKMKGAVTKWKGKKGERRRRNERVLLNQTWNTVKVGYPHKKIFLLHNSLQENFQIILFIRIVFYY